VRATIRKTFVAELGGGAPGAQYLARAKCTRCFPEWLGPRRSLLEWLRDHPATDYAAGLERVRAQATRDVLRHVDRAHGGRL
jgi:hypothetical protein